LQALIPKAKKMENQVKYFSDVSKKGLATSSKMKSFKDTLNKSKATISATSTGLAAGKFESFGDSADLNKFAAKYTGLLSKVEKQCDQLIADSK
jgi:hypothetical protein